MDIIVVGGGFSGLLMASRIEGSVVFEENPRVGVPPHCTGLVSRATVDLIGYAARESIVSRYRVIRVHRLFGGELFELVPDQDIVRLDRILLEELLAKETEDRGSRVITRSRVLDVGFDGSVSVEIDGSVRTIRGSLVINAEGSSQRFSRRLGISGVSSYYVGVQGYTVCSGEVGEEEIGVYVDDRLSRGFFSWVVPLDDRRCVVGTAYPLGDRGGDRIEILAKILSRRGVLLDRRVRELYGGLILRGYPSHKHHRGRLIAIGDSSGFVKPFSGGGLYPSSLQVGVISSRLRRHGFEDAIARYYRDVRRHIDSLRIQWIATKILERLGIEKILVKLVELGIIGSREVFSYDSHERFLVEKILGILGKGSKYAHKVLGLKIASE
jgi:flavin-dependent dehydrogenase